MAGSDGKKGTIVVVAAHPDDETLGCGGAIARRVDEGHEVVIVVLTDGSDLLRVCLGISAEPSPEEVGRIRKDETRRAAGILGVPKENVQFLGYEDGGLARQENRAAGELARLLVERRPTEVWFPNGYEGHADHMAANRIAREACGRTGREIRRLQYVVSLKYGLPHEDILRRFTGIDVSAYLPLKERAVRGFRSHLGMLSDKQEEPLWSDCDRYLRPQEMFLADE